MFSFAFLIGVFAYVIYALGLAQLLYPQIVQTVTSIFFIVLIVMYGRRGVKEIIHFREKAVFLIKKRKLHALLVVLIILQGVVNSIGALGPELGFDALWYHLTLPKLYLQNHAVFYIPGGLLYYSVMPKLGEMFYTASLSLDSEIAAKLVHFSFGILSSIALFSLARRYLSTLYALLAVAIFYGNLVVAWESITAYIDLFRTFFEIMALWGFLLWYETKKLQWFIESAILTGLALASKILAVGTLGIFLLLTVFIFLSKESLKKRILHSSLYFLLAFLIISPWLLHAYIQTGNPVYPFFSSMYSIGYSKDILSPLSFLSDVWGTFMYAADPISPLYTIVLPLVFFMFKKFRPEMKLVSIFCALAIIVWYVTPRTGGGRFLLPYLPAFSLVVAYAIKQLERKKIVHAVCVGLVILVTTLSIGYRGVANAKYLPVILGGETKVSFISKNLNFAFGDFYDTDGYFAKKITEKDRVLLYGFHNLYYVNFPFIDASWVKSGDTFNYIAVQKATLPRRFGHFKLLYYNKMTNVKLYTSGGEMWTY